MAPRVARRFFQKVWTKVWTQRHFPRVRAAADRWTPTHRLGEGGMGEVFLAVRDRDGVELRAALKRPADLVGPSTRRQFEAEARVLAKLRHANIAGIIDAGLEPDPYIALEYVEGVTLDALLEQRPDGLPADMARLIAIELAHALAYAHEAGVAHRDVKPSNVLLSLHGEVKLADFGIAKLVGGTTTTTTGMVRGTPAYMSPEQATGGKVDHRTDLYSLGMVFAESATGHRQLRYPEAVPLLAESPDDRRSAVEFIDTLEGQGVASKLDLAALVRAIHQPPRPLEADSVKEPMRHWQVALGAAFFTFIPLLFALQSLFQGSTGEQPAPAPPAATPPAPEPSPPVVLPSMKVDPSPEGEPTEPAEPVRMRARTRRRPTTAVRFIVLPQGRVWVDERLAGTAPLTLELEPGVHSVWVGRERQERFRALRVEGESQRAVFDLREDP
ncbi:MAG: serine/threonine-protein kinase [Myxococcota bacterium]